MLTWRLYYGGAVITSITVYLHAVQPMFLVNALQVMCGRRVIAVSSCLRSLKFAYVSSDLAGQAFLFLSGFLYSFFAPPISPVFFYLPA